MASTKPSNTWLGISDAQGWEFVSSQSASASSSIEFTGFSTGYDYMIQYIAVIPDTDSRRLQLELGVSGPTYRTSGYKSTRLGQYFNGSTAVSTGGDESAFVPVMGDTQGNATDENGSGYFVLIDPAASTDTYYNSWGSHFNTGSQGATDQGGGHYTTAEAHVAARLKYNSGNIASGTFKLFRIANA